MSDASVYEKLGVFYLGRPRDLARGETLPEPLLYDSRDLLTHGVVVGMTGSGKTGLLISMLEEAAIDRIPALVVDPKGDLANLLLTFPELAAADFAPWIDRDAAARAGVSPEDFAAQEAAKWQKGLAAWDQSGERIGRLREAVDLALYTPGSEAGLPVSVLASFAPPPPETAADGDLFRERIVTVVSSLLSLLGIEADPVKGRETILLSTLFETAWRAGRPLDLPDLIGQIQKPPVTRVGVMDIESFYPAKERFELAMAVNNLLASPSFAPFREGTPLDIGQLLYTETGKPRIAIFSIAHLGDQERMFFVALLLNQVLGWMRSQPGTSSLRALLCMDEVVGYMPPVAAPPSKRPLLTLLKQARAFGLGVVLATQNPVDLDYKGLANVGSWFLGRLQTEQDRARLIEGISGSAGSLPREEVEKILAGLAKRNFLLHDVHEEEPVVFESRWALSYLRGPLTRPEIQRLTAGRKAASGASGAAGAAPQAPASGFAAAPAGTPATSAATAAPILPPEVTQRFLPLRRRPQGTTYEPRLFATAVVHYADAKLGIEQAETISLLARIGDDGVDWYAAEPAGVAQEELEREGAAGAAFAPLPESAVKARSYGAWEKDLAEALFRTRRLEIAKSADFGAVARPGESERDFRIRLGDLARERRDAETAALREKYRTRATRLQERLARAKDAVARQEEQASQQKWKAATSFGGAVLGVLFGRGKLLSSSTINKASRVVSGVGRASKESGDVTRAEESLESVNAEIAALNAELEGKVAELADRFDAAAAPLETVAVKPKKADVEVRFLCLAWAPYDGGEPAWG